MVRIGIHTTIVMAALVTGLGVAQECRTPGQLLSADGQASSLWAANRQLEIVRIPEGAEVAYYVYGDEVDLKRDLPELVRPVGTTATKVSRVVIDARVVVINDRLSLSDASLSIQAHSVKFTPAGVIVFPTPPQGRAQRLDITAAVLDLSEATRTVFRFSTRDWAGGTWPQPGQPGRTVNVTVGKLMPHPNAPAGAEWLRWHTLDNGQSPPAQYWDSVYSQVTGAEGARLWKQRMLLEQRWPQYYLNRIITTYAQAPYRDDVRRFVLSRLHLLDVLNERRSNVVYPQLVQFRATLERGVDLFGQTEAAVPLLDVKAQVDALKVATDTYVYGSPTQPALLAQWDAEWINTLKASSLDQQLINYTQTQFATRWKEIDGLDRQIGDLFTQLAATRAKTAQTQQRVADRLETLKGEWEKRLKDADGNVGNVKVVQTVAVAAGTLYPPAAAVAATVAQGLDVLAGGICSAVQGKTGFSAAFNAIEESGKRRSQLDAALKDSETAYEAQKDAKAGARRFLAGSGTDADRKDFGKFTSTVGQWATATGKALNSLRAGGCGDQQVPQFDQDQTLKAQLGELEPLNAAEASVLARLADLQGRQQDLTLDTVSLQTTLRDLQALTLGNEVARIRAAHLAGVVRQQLYSRLLQRMAQLRRALVAAGVSPLSIPQDLWFSPLALRIDWQADAWTKSQEQWKEVLDGRRAKLGLYLNTFLTFADDQLTDLNNQVLSGAFVPINFFAGSAAAGVDAPSKQAFLAAVNRSLQEVYRLGQRSELQVHVPVRIPFDVELADQPEYFVNAVVRTATFTPARPDLEIVFEIYNAGAGQLSFPGRCVQVNSDGSSLVKARSTTVASDEVTDWQAQIDSVVRSRGMLQQSVPFKAAYYMIVKLPQSKSWPAPPQVSQISIDFVKRGPK